MRLKSNIDMFLRRGDDWSDTGQHGYFKPERLLHHKADDIERSRGVLSEGFERIPAELGKDYDDNPDISQARCKRRNLRQHSRKAGIIGPGFLPEKRTEKTFREKTCEILRSKGQGLRRKRK